MSDCTRDRYDPRISLKEKRSGMTFLNPTKEKVEENIVDDCLIKKGKRCDYLVRDKDDYEYFVELKSKEIEHACKQLEASMRQLSQVDKKHCIVICTRNPLSGTDTQKLKRQFKQKYNATLSIKKNKFEQRINS